MPEITKEQAQVVREQLGPTLRYLGKLRDRLKANGFTERDVLYQLTLQAYDSAFSLSIQFHYISCGGVFGIGAQKTPPGSKPDGESTRG